MVARSAEVEDEIIRRLSDGEPLRSICRDEHMPSWRAIYDWMDDAEFASRIAHAREVGADAIAEDILDIVDDSRNDWVEKNDRDGNCIGYQLNGDHVQRSKLRAEMRLKLLAKWQPKKYGDKIQADLNHSGSVVAKLMPDMSLEEMARAYEDLRRSGHE